MGGRGWDFSIAGEWSMGRGGSELREARDAYPR